MLKSFADLTKFGIVIFVLLTGLAGYMTSFESESSFHASHILTFLVGLYLISSGSLALNQVQEYKADQKMARTAKRPVASGRIKPMAAGILAISMILAGAQLLAQVSFLSAALSLLSVLLYNGFYTYWWKPSWAFAAIPGALPGSLPVTIGYAANSENIFAGDSVYLFLLLFLWQMPHFWALAIKYREDYAKGNFPTLPVVVGVERALYHTGVYTFLYVIMALAAPVFVRPSWVYLGLVLPMGIKIIIEFRKLFLAKGDQHWLSFFMWVNVSILVFVFIPVLDRWNFLVINSN